MDGHFYFGNWSNGWQTTYLESVFVKDPLVQEAPRLPVPTCTNPLGCKCVYKHFDDRRRSPRRTSEGARYNQVHSFSADKQTERRLQRGRRSSDA